MKKKIDWKAVEKAEEACNGIFAVKGHRKSLSGTKISHKEAYNGLGNPKTWKNFSDKLKKEFREKPKTINYIIEGL